MSPRPEIVASIVCAVVVAGAGCAGGESPPLQNGVSVAEHSKLYFPIDKDNDDPHAIGIRSQNGQPISCDECHEGADAFRTPQCQKCHSLDPVSLEVAHIPVAGFIKADQNCYECHPDGLPGDQIGIPQHSVAFFPIDVTDVHGSPTFNARLAVGQDSCGACHLDEIDRRKTACQQCHLRDSAPTLEVGHQNVSIAFNLLPGSSGCKACHGANVPIVQAMHPIANHTFFAVGHHIGDARCPTDCDGSCTRCHDAFKTDTHLFAVDYSVANCVGCHRHGADCTTATQGNCH